MKLNSLTLASTLIFAGIAAQAAVVAGDELGTTEVEIRTALEGAGYVIESVEIDGDEIEAEVTIGGVSFEIEISGITGLVQEVEAEEDDS